MKGFKIVFTGGPCAGKSTQIDKISEYLSNRGEIVVIVPETATDLIRNSKINPKLINSLVNFQTIMLNYQYFKEKQIDEIINGSDKKIVALYDRGILDNKAYFKNSTDFDYIMKNIDKKEIEILDSYDAVIDLISLATCNPEKYNITSNEARMEKPAKARMLDNKTSNVWVGHRNFNMVNSDVSIDDEFEIIKDKVDKILEREDFKKITTVKLNNELSDFKTFNDSNSRLIKIEKMIIDFKRDTYCEILKRTYKNKSTYVLNIKANGKLISEVIPYEEYMEFIKKYKILDIIYYDSLNFVRNKQAFEVKFYDDKTTLEYEENEMNKGIKFPKVLKLSKK